MGLCKLGKIKANGPISHKENCKSKGAKKRYKLRITYKDQAEASFIITIITIVLIQHQQYRIQYCVLLMLWLRR